ncbi:MAG: AAA family ATPase [Firmicutes bacterium]|nr:AAA family ATPase [Bacillota bacterium]
MVAGFVGRGAQLAAIDRCLELAKEGHGRALLILGEMGLGKTRLLHEASERARAQRFRVLWGRAHPLENDLAYAPFIEMFHAVFGELSPQTRRAVLAELPALGRLLGIAGDQEGGGGLPTPLEKAHLFAAVLQFIKLLARDGPLVLMVDDLQDADVLSLDLFHYLVRFLGDVPALLAGTSRLQGLCLSPRLRSLRQTLSRDGAGEVMSLAPLSADEVGALARGWLERGEPSKRLLKFLVDRSGGFPLYLELLLRSLNDQGRLQRIGTTWDMGGEPRPVTSPSLQALILDELAPFAGDEREVLNLLAVAGRQLPYKTLNQLVSVDDTALLRSLERLSSAGVITETATAGSAAYEISHPLYREVLYETASEIGRRITHARLAEHFGAERPDIAAHHYCRAGDHGNAEKAVAILWLSGNRARAVRAFREADQYLTAALRHVRKGVRSELLPHILESLGEAREQGGEWTDARALYEEALQLQLSQPHSQATLRLYLRLTSVAATQADFEAANRYLDQAQRLLGDEDVPGMMVELQFNRCSLFFLAGDTEPLRTGAATLRRIASAAGSSVAMTQYHLAAVMAHLSAGEWRDAKHHVRLALEVAEKSGDVEWRRRTHDIGASLAFHMADHGTLRRQAQFSLELTGTAENADVSIHPRAHLHRLMADFFSGDWLQALDRSDVIIASVDRAADVRSLSLAWLCRALIMAFQGDLDEVDVALHQASQLAGPTSDANQRHLRHVVLVRRALVLDEPERALSASPTSEEEMLRAKPLLLGLFAEAYLRAGQNDRALEVVQALEEHGKRGSDFAGGLAALGRGIVTATRGETAKAEHSLEQAVQEFSRLRLPYWRATSEAKLAELKASRQPVHARRMARSSAVAFGRLGARPEQNTAQALLHRLGGRLPRLSKPDSVEVLSAREKDVARLVAQGFTNREVAARLYISPRTVETHLQRIYTKLSLSNRVELVRYLATSDRSVKRSS